MNFAEALRMNAEIYHALKAVLKEKGLATAVGDEAVLPRTLTATKKPLPSLSTHQKSGYKPGKEVVLAIDTAASGLLEDGKYVLKGEGVAKTSAEMVDWYEALCEKYPIISIEDGLGEDDWDGWKLLTDRLGKKVQIVGDDLLSRMWNALPKGLKWG